MMEKELLHILQHSLGLDQYGQGRQYRNHFVAGGKDVERCRDLAGMGYMVERDDNGLTGGSPWFSVTGRGEEAVALFSPAPPPPPKVNSAQKRYLDHLRYDGGLTFAESLGITVPEVETRYEWAHGKTIWQYRYRRTIRYCWGLDVIEGEWKPTKKEAKASYKAALAARNERKAA